MAKHKERAQAKDLFLQGMAQNKIAEIVGVTEKTVNGWCDKYGWKQQYEAKINGDKERIQDIKMVIGFLTKERLEIREKLLKAEKQGKTDSIEEYGKRINQIANEVAMFSKTLSQLDDDKKLPLTTYIKVMEEIFSSLQKSNPKLYQQTLDFQSDFLDKISLKY